MVMRTEELESLWDAAEEAADAEDVIRYGGILKLLLGHLLLETFGDEYLSIIPDDIGQPSTHRVRTARPYFFNALNTRDREEAQDFAQQCLQLAVPKVQSVWRQQALTFHPGGEAESWPAS